MIEWKESADGISLVPVKHPKKNNSDMDLAPDVMFDEEAHEYWYKGRKLSGITGMVSKKLGLKYNGDFVGEHTEEGIHVHKAIQRWIETGNIESVHPGVQWLVGAWHYANVAAGDGAPKYSEVLVSDFRFYASAIDIVEEWPDGTLRIYDIKKGKFNREYATWQLSIYKYFVETYAKRKVSECVCICLKDKEYYPIFTKSAGDVEKLLYGKLIYGTITI